MKPTTSVRSIGALIVLLLGALASTAAAQSWVQLSPTGGPPANRGGHTAVLDAASNRMTVFGGDSDLTVQRRVGACQL